MYSIYYTDTYMITKRIQNPSTAKYYSIRQKSTLGRKKISFFTKKSVAEVVKKKYGAVIKRLGST